MESKVRTQRPVEDTQEEVVQVGPKGVYHMDNTVVSVASQPVGGLFQTRSPKHLL